MCKCAVWIFVPLLWAALSPLAMAEYVPPPKLDDLVQADFAAVGHFVEADGGIRFIADRALWGEADLVGKLLDDEDCPVRTEESGLTAWTWGSASGVITGSGGGAEDATQRALWFFFRDRGPDSLAAAPADLAEDFLAVRRGERPSLLFRLLQRFDFDMRRAAMEELVAHRDRKVLADLHRIALANEFVGVLNAVDVLLATHLVDAERFWGRWTDHEAAAWLLPALREQDADRVTRELRNAVATETRPARVEQLLYLAGEDDDLNLDHLDHAAEQVRARALSNLYARLWVLARQPAPRAQFVALGRRVLPLLRARRELETAPAVLRILDRMLEEKDGVPWVQRAPDEVETPPAYSEAEERAFVVSRLTSSVQGGFPMESAGREVVEHFLQEGFDQLKRAAASPDFNAPLVYEGMGYVRDPVVFAHLVACARTMGVGDDSFPAVLRAIGRQNNERSFEVLKEIIASRCPNPAGFAARGLCDALGLVRDERALRLLQDLKDRLPAGCALPYVRAWAAHGDPFAVHELLAEARKPHPSEVPEADEVIEALLLVDTPEATEALERHLRAAWPTRWESFDEPGFWWCMDLQNYAGSTRRTTPLGEVARRDPRWLAELALQEMASDSVSARISGAYIFRGLTGRLCGFRPEAFAAERRAPLDILRGWWAAHADETREQWLLSWFREQGFPMTHLHGKDALPVLVRALSADPLTHGLAVEQISVITGKYFGNYAQPTLECDGGSVFSIGGGGYERQKQEQTTARVIGWLKARDLLPAGR